MPSSKPSESLPHACSEASWYLREDGCEEAAAEIGKFLDNAYNRLLKETATQKLEELYAQDNRK